MDPLPTPTTSFCSAGNKEAWVFSQGDFDQIIGIYYFFGEGVGSLFPEVGALQIVFR